jgi:diguanylate cyclase (GGDEF)-like protein
VPGIRLPLTGRRLPRSDRRFEAADRAFLVRWFAYSYGFCATVVLASLPFTGERVTSPLGIAASTALTYGLVAVMLVGRDRLPVWFLQGLPFVGTAVVTAILFSATPGTTGAFAFLYFVVALAAFYSYGLGTAIAQLVAVVLAYAITVAARDVGDGPIYFVVFAGTLTLAGGLLMVLRARNDSTIAALGRQATTDPLTGLLNRRGWERRLDEEFERARRGGRPFTIAFADLDGLKRVNDERGHAVGDAALTRFADRIERTKRMIDAAGRLGGDEFALVLPDTDATGAMKGVNRVRASARQSFDQAGLPLSASFGLADYPAAATTLADLMEAADAALYEAKAGGGDRVVGSCDRPQQRETNRESTNA